MNYLYENTLLLVSMNRQNIFYLDKLFYNFSKFVSQSNL